MHAHCLTRFALSLLLLTAAAGADAQVRTPRPDGVRSGPAAHPPREAWQRVPDIFASLRATTGSRIADLGAGEGWLTTRLARQVGPTGRIFAVDISAGALEQLAERLAKDTLKHVELVLAEDDDPRLPFGTLDGVVILNAYHEMTKRVPVLDGIKRALKPGGVIVIVDNKPPDTVVSRKDQVTRHTLALEFARDDLEAQGFEIVSTHPSFIDHKEGDHVQRQWMVVARRSTR